MENRLENLRKFFPVEVTAAYVAIQGILNANKIGPSEFVWFMLTMIGLLAIANIAIYWKFYKTTNVLVHAVLLLGFIIWIVNIDTERFIDVPYIGEYTKLFAQISLVLYSLITPFVEFPKRDQ